MATAEEPAIPARPEKLEFGPLDFEVPDGNSVRHTLPSGVVVYVVEDHALPLVDVEISLRIGDYLDPADKLGLNSLTGTMLRQGGTASLPADELDEKIEFLAASIRTEAGDSGGNFRRSASGERAVAAVNCITPVLDESLALFFEILRTPGFDEGRLEVEKANLLEAMKQRNDDANDLLRREWSRLLLGDADYAAREPTKANLEGLGRDDLVAFHARYWRPENMVIAVSGDVVTAKILSKLEGYLAGWPGSGEAAPWPPPQPAHEPVPGLYHVEKDIPQGKVLIGHLTRRWDDFDGPDLPAMQVMNFVLGGSGFTSRIQSRVRSDEGLAYSAFARMDFDPLRPGDFAVSFQSKSPTVALAARISLEEVRRIQAEPISAEELGLAKSSLTETFPRRFESARQRAATFASDAFIGRDHGYWQSWRERIGSVTAEDVQRVAKKYLKPEEMVFLVVGKWQDIAPGDADNRASMEEFGPVKHLPERDPLTLEPRP